MAQETVKAKMVLKVAYRIVMSRGDDIQIDADELPKILAAIQSGSPAIVRQGIFNPSYYVSVVRDEKRITEFLNDTKYQDEATQARRAAGLLPLKDIFADAPLKLESGQTRALPRGRK